MAAEAIQVATSFGEDPFERMNAGLSGRVIGRETHEAGAVLESAAPARNVCAAAIRRFASRTSAAKRAFKLPRVWAQQPDSGGARSSPTHGDSV